jgi:hypothetical protein
MATYNVGSPTPSGVVVAPIAVSASDTFPVQQGGKYVLVVRNGGGSPDTVVVDDPNTALPTGAAPSSTFADISKSVVNATEQAFLIDANRHRDPVTGLVTVTHSFITTVTAVVYGPL